MISKESLLTAQVASLEEKVKADPGCEHIWEPMPYLIEGWNIKKCSKCHVLGIPPA